MVNCPDIARFAGDTQLAQALLKQVNARIDRPISLMEVCGTHTMAISATGVRKAVDPRLRLVSGPGCPVCVTAQEDLDAAIELARRPDVIITTFGDMMRVPGSETTLEREAAQGRDVRVVYSPLEALKLAQDYPNRTVVFLGVGFETTAPTVAAAVKLARARKLKNFLVVPLFKTMPRALRAIAAAPNLKIDGFILPGHVSTIIGRKPYEFLAREFNKPCCIVGFELLDLIQGILMLLEQLTEQHKQAKPTRNTIYHKEHRGYGKDTENSLYSCAPRVEIQYKRSALPDGNPEARRLLAEVFRPCNASWRGLGEIPGSGLTFRPSYARFDALAHFAVRRKPARPVKGCRCGDVLLGAITPPECRMFGRNCTPENPLGPCMVSSEGACAAYYKHER